jgi:hypothetical protein
MDMSSHRLPGKQKLLGGTQRKEGVRVQKNSLFIFLGLMLISLWHPAGLGAADTENTRDSLRGLPGIYVSVEALEKKITRAGLTPERIRRKVVLQLQRAGIRTLSRKEWQDAAGSPFLYVNAHVLKLQETPEYVYSIALALRQNVYPVREPIQIIGAATWSTGTITGITSQLDKIPAAVADRVGRFIDAYYYVNPR